jgi:hypothetical protein
MCSLSPISSGFATIFNWFKIKIAVWCYPIRVNPIQISKTRDLAHSKALTVLFSMHFHFSFYFFVLNFFVSVTLVLLSRTIWDHSLKLHTWKITMPATDDSIEKSQTMTLRTAVPTTDLDPNLPRVLAKVPETVWVVAFIAAAERFTYWGITTPWREWSVIDNFVVLYWHTGQRTTCKILRDTKVCRVH